MQLASLSTCRTLSVSFSLPSISPIHQFHCVGKLYFLSLDKSLIRNQWFFPWSQSIRNVGSILPSLGRRTIKWRESILEDYEKTRYEFYYFNGLSFLDYIKAKLEQNHCHWSRKVGQKTMWFDYYYVRYYLPFFSSVTIIFLIIFYLWDIHIV